jgi:hypothetical protein
VIDEVCSRWGGEDGEMIRCDAMSVEEIRWWKCGTADSCWERQKILRFGWVETGDGGYIYM